MEILFIAKEGDANAQLAADYVKQIYPNTRVVFGKRTDKLPEDIRLWEGDFIFSYLSPWIIPNALLVRAKKGAINWHPGPPEYPGIGCTNFAIYNKESEFGITCHYMAAKVDTGALIEVRRFPLHETDTLYSITQKCYSLILNSFYFIFDKIILETQIPQTKETWKRLPYTRKELDELCIISPEMELEEIESRIKATTYDRPWAYTEIKGIKFTLPCE